MNTLLYTLLGIVVLVFSYKINLFLGLGITVIGLGLLIYTYIPAFYASKGNQAFAAGDYAQARAWYQKVYDTGRAKVKLRVSYAFLLLRTGEEDEAETVLNGILMYKHLKPEDRNLAKQNRCMVYYKQGCLEEALEDALELFENGYVNTTMYGMIGYFKLLRQDPLEETMEFCQEAYEFNNEDRDILDNLTMCYWRQGDYEKAEEFSEEVIEGHPQFVEGFYHGAQIQMKLGNWEKAKEYTERISSCRRSAMTTVSEEDVSALQKEIEKQMK